MQDVPFWIPIAVGTALGAVSIVLLASRYMSELRQIHPGWFVLICFVVLGGYLAALWPFPEREKLLLAIAPGLWTAFVVGLLPQAIILHRVIDQLKLRAPVTTNATWFTETVLREMHSRGADFPQLESLIDVSPCTPTEKDGLKAVWKVVVALPPNS